MIVSPFFCLKAGHKFSFCWRGLQTLISPEKAPEESANNLTPLPSSHIVTFPVVCCPGKPEMAFLCPVIPLLVFVQEDLQASYISLRFLPCDVHCTHNCLPLGHLSFCQRVTAENLGWVEVKLCLLYRRKAGKLGRRELDSY